MVLKNQKKLTITLWIIQSLLAAMFLFAGGIKFVLPVEVMTKEMPLPGWFLHFIGTAEILGALGLILPGLVRIHQELTSLAAAGLVIIMIGASVISAMIGGLMSALLPMVVGMLLLFVTYNRSSIFGTTLKPEMA